MPDDGGASEVIGLAEIERPPLLDRMRITEPAARGLAYGTASHIIGTSRAVRESELAAACAGLALSLNAFATAVLLPPLWGWSTSPPRPDKTSS